MFCCYLLVIYLIVCCAGTMLWIFVWFCVLGYCLLVNSLLCLLCFGCLLIVVYFRFDCCYLVDLHILQLIIVLYVSLFAVRCVLIGVC